MAPVAGPPWRLLLVGYGPRGRRWHEHAARRRDVAVAGLVDPCPDVQLAAVRAGLSLWASPADAAESVPLDGAVIASPPAAHVGAALECLGAGLGVLVEKPFTLSLASATTVARAAEVARRPVLVAQNFRYLARERAIAQAGLEATVGRPLEGVIGSRRAAAAVSAHVAALANGALWDFSLHHFDALRVRLGAPPDRVDAQVAGATISVDLWWAGGRHISYRHDDDAAGYGYQEHLGGPAGTIDVDDQRVTATAAGRRGRRVRPGRVPAPEEAILDEFLAALATGAASSLAASDNLLTVAMVEAVATSARMGRPVAPAEIWAAAGMAPQ